MRVRVRFVVPSFILLITLLLAAACQDEVTAPAALAPPNMAISDATRDGGNPGFFWLAPLVRQPPTSEFGEFAPGLQPTLKLVCLSTTDPDLACDPTAAIEEWGLGSGLILHEGDHYQLDLHTDEHGLVGTDIDTTVYRLEVLTDSMPELGGPFLLGFADFQLGGNGRDAKNLSTGDVIGLVDGRTLPVKFRIDRGAYEHELREAQATAPGDPDGVLCQENCTVEVVLPTQTTEVSLGDTLTGEEVTGVLFEQGDVAEPSIVVIDERRTEGEDANCATGVTIDKQFCYRYRIFPDVEFNNDVRFGICPRDLAIGPGTYWRIFKVDFGAAGEPIVTRPDMVDVSDFLPCQPSSGAIGALRSAARYALSLLVTPLHADFADKVWGGSAKDFSDMFWAEDATMQPIGAADTTAAAGTLLTRGVLVQSQNWEEPTVPKAGAEVTFRIVEGTGSLEPAQGFVVTDADSSADHRVVGLTGVTDAAGKARVEWTIAGGLNRLEATSPDAVADVGAPIPAAFTATGLNPGLEGLVVDANNYQLALNPNHVGMGYFRGTNALFAAQLSYGTDAQHLYFLDTSLGRESFVEAGTGPFVVENSQHADHYTAALLVESDAPFQQEARQRLDLLTVRETFAWSAPQDADFLILRYTLFNPGAQDIEGLHAGFFADIDLTGSLSENVSSYDAQLEAAVVSTADTDVRSAYVLLDHAAPVYRHWVNPGIPGGGGPQDPPTLAGWFSLLSGATSDAGTLGPADVRSGLNIGAVTVPAGGTVTLSVALIGADDSADVATNVLAARTRWTDAALPAVQAHAATLELTPLNDGGYSADLIFPTQAVAAQFVAADARCGHDQVQLPADGAIHGDTVSVLVDQPAAGPHGRYYCSGRLADGSFFTGWDTVFVIE